MLSSHLTYTLVTHPERATSLRRIVLHTQEVDTNDLASGEGPARFFRRPRFRRAVATLLLALHFVCIFGSSAISRGAARAFLCAIFFPVTCPANAQMVALLQVLPRAALRRHRLDRPLGACSRHAAGREPHLLGNRTPRQRGGPRTLASLPHTSPCSLAFQDLLDQFALPALAESCAFRTAGPGRLEFGRAGPCVMIKVVVVALGTMVRFSSAGAGGAPARLCDLGAIYLRRLPSPQGLHITGTLYNIEETDGIGRPGAGGPGGGALRVGGAGPGSHFAPASMGRHHHAKLQGLNYAGNGEGRSGGGRDGIDAV